MRSSRGAAEWLPPGVHRGRHLDQFDLMETWMCECQLQMLDSRESANFPKSARAVRQIIVGTDTRNPQLESAACWFHPKEVGDRCAYVVSKGIAPCQSCLLADVVTENDNLHPLDPERSISARVLHNIRKFEPKIALAAIAGQWPFFATVTSRSTARLNMCGARSA